MNKSKKLGIDLGTKSMGIALSYDDSMAIGVESYTFLENDFDKAITRIAFYLEEYQIDTIVLGYPILPLNHKTKITYVIENFAKKIKSNFVVNLVYVNEAFTTKEANKMLIEANLSLRKRKKNNDQVAAQLILQRYLDKQQN